MKIDILLFLFYVLSILNIVTCNTECPNVNVEELYNDRRQDKNKLRLVQYNVEWLFVDHYSNFDCPGLKCTWKNKTHALEHLSDVSNIISKLNPDIINLCEVEGCDELNLVVDKLGPLYKSYLKFGTDVGTGQNVGMITKIDPKNSLYRSEEKIEYPIEGSKCGNVDHSSTSGVSKHYITEFELNNLKVAFIGAHLIAYPTNPIRCSQREAQAQVLQNVIADFIKGGYEVIVTGDMNDFDGETLDMNSNVPISRTLDIIKGNNGTKAGNYQLTNVVSLIPISERYSDWWNSDNDCSTSSSKDYSVIDHILVTKHLLNYIKDVFIYHGYNEYCDKIHSDHYPVVVDFEF